MNVKDLFHYTCNKCECNLLCLPVFEYNNSKGGKVMEMLNKRICE